MIDFSKRFVEVDEILNYLSEADYKKIPTDIIDYIKRNKDNTYTWKYDTTKKLKDQNVSDDTMAILSYLNMEYLLNNEQRELMGKLHSFYERRK